jgi:transposase-like protein
MKSGRPRYSGHRLAPGIISYAVWVYHRFCLSFRDVEDLLAGRAGSFGEPWIKTATCELNHLDG